MPKVISDYDYLSVSARVHAMENRLLTRERVERMLEARSADEAAKVLSECGYRELEELTPTGIEQMLSGARLDLFRDLKKSAPDPRLVDVFAMKYDYHNAKVLLKARAMGQAPDGLLVDTGRYSAPQLQEDFAKDDLRRVGEVFRKAMGDAATALAQTGDPQKADFILDRAYFAELLTAAQAVGDAFLLGYARLTVDVANLRATVRSKRMGRDGDFLKRVLIPGGKVDTDHFMAAMTGSGDLVATVGRGALEGAATAGTRAMDGGALTEFERLCDDAVMAYLASAKRVAFGAAPLVGYLYAREAEFTAIRVMLTGRLAGLDGDTLRGRLRTAYV